MDALVGLIVLLAFGGLVFVVLRFFWRILVGLARMGTTPVSQPRQQRYDVAMTAEEEGNVHSGPYGYSPNTAYPETQYGSGFDPDAEWNHEEQ